MNRTMVWTLVLAVGMLTIASVAASRPYPGGPRSVVFSSEPIPCQVYLKAKHSVETQPNYVPDSFFQAKVQILRMELDVARIQQVKTNMQARLDSYEGQDANRALYAEKVEKALETIEDDEAFKAPFVRVLEILEGVTPGEEIVLNVGDPRGLARGNMYYVLGYQGQDQYVHAAGFLRSPQEVREEKTVMGTFKKWVRWLISECDNV